MFYLLEIGLSITFFFDLDDLGEMVNQIQFPCVLLIYFLLQNTKNKTIITLRISIVFRGTDKKEEGERTGHSRWRVLCNYGRDRGSAACRGRDLDLGGAVVESERRWSCGG